MISLSSVTFVFGLLPIFLAVYFLSKPKYRMYELVVFSLWFYYVNSPKYFLAVLGQVVVVYIVTLLMARQKEREKNISAKILLFIGIIINIACLIGYKYVQQVSANEVAMLQSLKDAGMEIEEIPAVVTILGHSFFTFSLIAFIADAYRGIIKVPRNIVKFIDYILMFPKIIMGPTVRYADVEGSMDNTEITVRDLGEGSQRFIIGFCKKAIIADSFAPLFTEINAIPNYSENTLLTLWIGSIAYSLQLFFDFSGYSDMAIGVARILGYHFKENFNYPYTCKSFSDFWRRWHISLSEWFRDYIYIPLGGSRKGGIRTIINLLVVWILTGLWHGVGYAFVVWGLVYFVMIAFERLVIKPDRLNKVLSVIWRIFTLLIVNFNWVLFSHGTLKEGLDYCLGMLGAYHGRLASAADVRIFREYGLYLILAVVFSTPIAKYMEAKISEKPVVSKVCAVVMPCLCLIAFVWALSFVMLGYNTPFMYQQF